MEVSDHSRKQIRASVERLLQRADAAGVFPTPLARLATAAGVREVIDIADLPGELLAKKPPAWKRILGAYLYKADVAFVDRSQASVRSRFTEAHETGHKLIPWHAGAFHLDDEKRLFRETEELFELEANLAAAEMIFQGTRFHDVALSYENSVKTPIKLSAQFGASIHASIRHYVENHPERLGLLVVGRFPDRRGQLPVWISVESRSFAERFGGLQGVIPAINRPDGLPQDPLSAAIAEAFSGPTYGSEEVDLTDLAGSSQRFGVEAFFNQHCLFVVFVEKTRLRRGRRLELGASSR